MDLADSAVFDYTPDASRLNALDWSGAKRRRRESNWDDGPQCGVLGAVDGAPYGGSR
jgi:hypothetical protein